MRQKRNNRITVCRLILSSWKEYPKCCCIKPLLYFREHSP